MRRLCSGEVSYKMEPIIQIAASFVGSTGFAALYHLHGKKLWISGFGGMLCWASYLGFQIVIENAFLTNLLPQWRRLLMRNLWQGWKKTPVTSISDQCDHSHGAGRNPLLYNELRHCQGNGICFMTSDSGQS